MQDWSIAWVLGRGLLAIGLSIAAPQSMAQTAPGPDAPKPLTATVIGKACLVDHVRFCPHGQAGSRPDIACLQQHHTTLRLSCRNTLRQAAGEAAQASSSAP